MFLLDTNAVSEPVKKRPNQGFMNWINGVKQDELFLSCFVVGELQKGVELTNNTPHSQHLQAFVNGVIETFLYTTFNFDTTAATLWGGLLANAQKAGKTPQMIDSLIAAQCIQNGLTLVTRNSKDFEQFEGLEVLNPWIS
jgi:toxin FitB